MNYQHENDFSSKALGQQHAFSNFNDEATNDSSSQLQQVQDSTNNNFQLMTSTPDEYYDPATTASWYYKAPAEANVDDLNQTDRGIAGFVSKLYQCLEAQDDGNKYAHWCKHNGVDMFMIDCIPKFTEIVLPHLFKHCKFASFVRQLNIYGFQRDTDARKSKGNRDKETCRWHHIHFRPGRRDLFHLIRRKSPRYSRKRKQSPNSETGEVDDEDPETVLHLCSGDDSSDTPMPQQELTEKGQQQEEEDPVVMKTESEEEEEIRSTGSLGRLFKESSPSAAPGSKNGINNNIQHDNCHSVVFQSNGSLADQTSSQLQEHQRSMRPDAVAHNLNLMCHRKSVFISESKSILQQGVANHPSDIYPTTATGFPAAQAPFGLPIVQQDALLSHELSLYNKTGEFVNVNAEFNGSNHHAHSTAAIQSEDEQVNIQILHLKREYVQMYNILSSEVNKSLQIIEAQRSRIEFLESAFYKKQQQQFSFAADDLSTSLTSTPTIYSHQTDTFLPLPQQEMNNNRSMLHHHQYQDNDVVIGSNTPSASLYPTTLPHHNHQPSFDCLVSGASPFDGYENNAHPLSVPFTVDTQPHQWLSDFSSH